MMVYFKSKISVSLLLFILTGCYDIPEDPSSLNHGSTGELLFDRVVIMGDSYSSGLMDGALYKGGQQFSYPSILIKQLNGRKLAQADIQSENGYNIMESTVVDNLGRYIATYRSKTSALFVSTPQSGELPTIFNGDKSSIEDFSIPGIKLNEWISGTSNVFWNRLGFGTSAPIDVLKERNPTFVLISVTDNILYYALNGSIDNFQSNNPGLHDALDPMTFENSLTILLNELSVLNEDIQLIIVNVPNIDEFPFFNKVDFNIRDYITLEIGSQTFNYYIEFNNQIIAYNFFTPGVNEADRRPYIEFDLDGIDYWGAVIEDPSLSDAVLADGSVIPKIRQINEFESITVNHERFLGKDHVGTQEPVQYRYAVTESKLQRINERIIELNNIINNISSNYENVKVFDLYNILSDVKSEPLSINGGLFRSDNTPSGIYSNDGMYLNPRGNSLIALKFIEFINQEYKAKIAFPNPNDYRGNKFMNDF